jgi:hypothetical protein
MNTTEINPIEKLKILVNNKNNINSSLINLILKQYLKK